MACSAPGAATDASTSSSAATPTTSPPTSPSPSTSTTASTTTTSSTTTTTSSTTTTASTTTLGDPTTTAGQIDQGDLAGWEIATITVGGTELLVAVADDPAERMQGLIGVDEVGDLDGMLFRFQHEAISGFTMKGTLLPLDIDFFGDDMGFVARLGMVPCSTDSCPSYVPDAPFSWALETPAGTLQPLDEGAVLSVGD